MQKTWRQDFEGDVALEVGVVGAVNGRHTASAKFGLNLITADCLHG
jgi:hypothetical protein